MTIAQIDSSPQALPSAKNDTFESKTDAESSLQGEKFGQVMSQVRMSRELSESPQKSADASDDTMAAFPSGQKMAESGQDMFFNIHIPVTDNWSLKAVTLGPTLNVITPNKAAPDDQSLEAFARSQGLDETAVQWLMGGQASPVIGSRATESPDALAAMTSATTAAVNPVINPATTAAMDSALGLPGSPESTDVDVSLANAMNSSGAGTWMPPQGNLQTANAEITASAGLAAGAALWTMMRSTESSQTASAMKSANTDSAETAEIQVQLLREPTPAAVWMLRNTISPETAAARRAEKTLPSLSELDLSKDISPELLDSLMPGPGENTASTANVGNTPHTAVGAVRQESGNTGQQAAADARAASNEAESSAARRSENIHSLAEKMGQAVGQRMLSEIEKGQWHLKLQLRPATLGHIEVEMRMISGEMDAVFTAPQALTRELLQDGLSRLKDTLNQMGMNVASMQVGDGQSRQRGGDSTPNKSSKSDDLIEKDSKSTISTTPWVPRQKMGEDGWDVLV